MVVVAGNGRRAPRRKKTTSVGDGLVPSAIPLEGLPENWDFEEEEPIGPELPDATKLNLIDGVWCEFVAQYYEAFRRTPQARQLRTRWEWMNFIYKMAVMDKSIKKRSYDGLAPEMRQAMNQYGDTPESKRKLKFDVPEADDMAAGVKGLTINFDVGDYQARRDAIS